MFHSSRNMGFELTGECCFSSPIFSRFLCCWSNHWSCDRLSAFLNNCDLSLRSRSQRLFPSHGLAFHFWFSSWKCFWFDYTQLVRHGGWIRSGQGLGAPWPLGGQHPPSNFWSEKSSSYLTLCPWACRCQYWPQYLVSHSSISMPKSSMSWRTYRMEFNICLKNKDGINDNMKWEWAP